MEIDKNLVRSQQGQERSHRQIHRLQPLCTYGLYCRFRTAVNHLMRWAVFCSMKFEIGELKKTRLSGNNCRFVTQQTSRISTFLPSFPRISLRGQGISVRVSILVRRGRLCLDERSLKSDFQSNLLDLSISRGEIAIPTPTICSAFDPRHHWFL